MLKQKKKIILAIGEKVGNLPLAINIVATHIKEFTTYTPGISQAIGRRIFDLQLLQYEG